MTAEARIVWLSFEVDEEGEVRTRITLETERGLRREERAYASLSAAEKALGPGFRDVVERTLAAESRRGRWRP